MPPNFLSISELHESFILQLGNNITVLVDTAPLPFRQALKRYLENLRNMAIKVLHAQRAVKNFEGYRAAGTFPSTIGCRSVPTCQCSKEYSEGTTEASKLAELQQVQQKHNK